MRLPTCPKGCGGGVLIWRGEMLCALCGLLLVRLPSST